MESGPRRGPVVAPGGPWAGGGGGGGGGPTVTATVPGKSFVIDSGSE